MSRLTAENASMCGRYDMSETPARLGSRYRVDMGSLDFAANADVRPTSTNPIIHQAEGKRIAELMRWGLIPAWAKDPKAISNPFNARSETAAEKPFFRGPFRRQRCLVPATAFYEWKAVEGLKKKTKFRIARADGDLVTLAGLYDIWRGPESTIHSYTILTTEPNDLMAEIHTRMPVILGEEEWDEWLAPATSADSLKSMCMPCPSDWLQAQPVG